jgi:hypothetical protein
MNRTGSPVELFELFFELPSAATLDEKTETRV